MSTDIFPSILPINVIQEDIDKAHQIREEFRTLDYNKLEGSGYSYSRSESCPISQSIKRKYDFDTVVTGVTGRITVEKNGDFADYYTDGTGADFIARADKYNDDVTPLLFEAQLVRANFHTRTNTN